MRMLRVSSATAARVSAPLFTKSVSILFLMRSGSLCVQGIVGKHNLNVCAQKLNPTGFQTLSFQDNKQTFTMVGGAVKKSIKKVVVVFFDNKQVTVSTKQGQAYKGKRKGKVRFFAVKHKGSSPLRTVLPKP